jgi:hypothetical protein
MLDRYTTGPSNGRKYTKPLEIRQAEIDTHLC